MKNKRNLKSNGITLIALVITIIILLILSGVAIATLTGDNGLFERAKQAKEKQIKSEMKEKLSLAVQELQVEKMGEAILSDITQEWVNKELNDYNSVVSDNTENEKEIIMSKNNITMSFIINENLKIKEISINKDELNLSYKYEIKEYKENGLKLLIRIENNDGIIDTIECPDGSILNCNNEIVEFNWEAIDGDKNNFIVNSGKKRKICTIQTKGMTKKDVVEIKTLEDFLEFRTIVNVGYSFNDKNINLKSDIDLSTVCYKVNGTVANDNSWMPIGNEINQFCGIFNGEEHTISNFYSNIENSIQGLFGYVSDGKILNITIKGDIFGKSSNAVAYEIGAISANCKNEEFKNCINYVKIYRDGAGTIGGIVGRVMEGDSKIIQCINYADIEGKQNVGGLIGAKVRENITIDECCNFGHIKVTYSQVGGIIGGTFAGNTTMSNCYNVGKITGTASDNFGRIGGIIGIAYSWNGSENISISNCYNVGEISKEAVYGGIVGLLYSDTSKFSNCYFENSCDQGTYTGIQSIDSTTLKSYANILGACYINDSNNINDGYPVLKWMVK